MFRWLCASTILAAALAAGCADDESGNPPGYCGFAPSGAWGTAQVASAGDPQLLVETTGTAQNQLDGAGRLLPDASSQGRPGILRYGACGTVGLIHRDGDESLVWMDVTAGAGTPEVVEADGGAGLWDSALLFDSACAPVVVRTSGAELLEYARGEGGVWTSEPVSGGLETVLGGAPSWISLRSSDLMPDGTFHLFLEASRPGAASPTVVHAQRAAATGAWTFAAVPALDAVEVYEYRADPDGSVHAAFNRTDYPCDPCNMDLYYGHLAGGVWTTETVQAGRWGDPDDEFAADPSLAVDAEGAPWIAANFQRRVVTGSLVSSELRFYGRNGDGWCSETIVSESDGYAGSDGTDFTGAVPQLAIDGTGRFHIAFGDVSEWHAEGMANGVVGQARYAVRVGSGWHVATLIEQAGQTESPQPLYAFDSPTLAVSADGTGIHLAGVERIWDTNSIYNVEARPVTLRAVLLRASVTLP